jgi:hypothetical protein
VVNVLFHLNVIELREFTSRPYCWLSDRFARAADIDSALACTLPHVSTASTRRLWKTEHDRSPSCGRLPAGGIRRAAPRQSQASQGLAHSNLGRDPTMGYDDDWMRGGCNHDASTLYR